VANFCIPKDIVEKISKQIDETSIAKLFDMTKKERIKFFAKHADDGLAQNISSSFDDILAEAHRDSLEKAMGLLGIKDKEVRNALRKEIRKLSNDDLLNPEKIDGIINELSGLATGSKITKEEVDEVIKLGAEVEKYKSVMDTNPTVKDGKFNTKFAEALEGFDIASDKMNKFIASHTTVSKSETFWSHAKASMLLKPASWLVNIESNVINTGLESISRRFGSGRMGGYNSEIVNAWKKSMAKIYRKTGNDYSRALSLDDMVTGKGKALGEVSTTGRDTWFTNMIYKEALGTPDAWTARMNFADAANIYSSKIADGLVKGTSARKAKAAEILGDALNVIPKTEDGKYVRQLAVEDAMRATYTNESATSKLSMTIKNAINSIPGIKKAKVGDLLEPFVKTPANVVEQGLDISGLGFLKGTVKLVKYFKTKKLDEKIAKQYLLGALKDGSKAGAGLSTAYLLSLAIDKDNFMGAYDPERSKWEQLRNSNYNAIKIGDKWVSMDYLGPLGSPLVAMLSAKKYGNDSFVDTIGGYLKGAASQITRIPFATSIAELYGSYKEATDVEKQKFLPVMQKMFMDQVASRTPGILSDIAKMTDTQIRDTSTGKFGKFGFNPDPIVAKIPWVANSLPEKRNIIGEDIKTEKMAKEDQFMLGLFSTIAAGARIKTEQSSPEGKEIYRLHKSGNAPTITNWRYPNGKAINALKDSVGKEKFREIFIDEFGPAYKSAVSELLQDDEYKEASDDEKKGMIDKAEDEVMADIYYNYDIET